MRLGYLWGVSLGLEGSEKCFLGTENLDSGGGVLGQVGQGSTIDQHYTSREIEDVRVRDEPCGNGLSDEGRQIGCDNTHFVNQVPPQTLPVLGELDDPLGKVTDVDQINLVYVTSHTSS